MPDPKKMFKERAPAIPRFFWQLQDVLGGNTDTECNGGIQTVGEVRSF